MQGLCAMEKNTQPPHLYQRHRPTQPNCTQTDAEADQVDVGSLCHQIHHSLSIGQNSCLELDQIFSAFFTSQPENPHQLVSEPKSKVFSQLYWRCWEHLGKNADFSYFLYRGWSAQRLQQNLVKLIEYSRLLKNSQALGYFSRGLEILISQKQLIEGTKQQKIDLGNRIFALVGATAGKDRELLIKTVLVLCRYSPEIVQKITLDNGSELLNYIFQNFNHTLEYFLCETLSRAKVPSHFIKELGTLIIELYDVHYFPNYPSRQSYRNSLLRILKIIQHVYPREGQQILQKLQYSSPQQRRKMSGTLSIRQNVLEDEELSDSFQSLILSDDIRQTRSSAKNQQKSFDSIIEQLDKLTLQDYRQNSLQQLIYEFDSKLPRKLMKRE